MGDDTLVSHSLRASLTRMAVVAHDKSLSGEDKSTALSKIATPALQMLEEVVNNVGGTRRALLDQLQCMIENGNWVDLPEPKNMGLTLDKVDQITAAIRDVQKNLVVDSTEIFRAFLEIMRKMMMENKFSQSVNHKLDINAAIAASSAKRIANEKQLSSELATSIAQGIGGLASLAGAGASLKYVAGAALKAKQATDVARGFPPRSPKSFKEQIKTSFSGTPKKETDSNTVHDLAKAPNSPNKKSAINNVKTSEPRSNFKNHDEASDAPKVTLESSSEESETVSYSQPSDPHKLSVVHSKGGNESADEIDISNSFDDAKVESRNSVSNNQGENLKSAEDYRKDSDIDLAKANAIQSLASGIGGLINSAGGIAAAKEKKDAGNFQADSDQQAVNREVAQKMHQAATESAAAAHSALEAAIQVFSAMQQSLASTGSALARNSV